MYGIYNDPTILFDDTTVTFDGLLTVVPKKEVGVGAGKPRRGYTRNIFKTFYVYGAKFFIIEKLYVIISQVKFLLANIYNCVAKTKRDVDYSTAIKSRISSYLDRDFDIASKKMFDIGSSNEIVAGRLFDIKNQYSISGQLSKDVHLETSITGKKIFCYSKDIDVEAEKDITNILHAIDLL